ncbi:MAG: hydrolase [Rhodospirillaceae bacterium]|nr:hydrolase [Rhodospirillaceae bacterium]
MLLKRDNSQLLVVDMQERLAPAIDDIAGVAARCGILLQGAAELAVPVLISEQYRKGLGATLPTLLALAGKHQAFEKVEFSCFANPLLRAALTKVPGRNTIICGTEAHVCVLQTALEMREAGHEVSLVADAVGSRRAESKSVAIARMRAAGIDVVTSEMVLFEWLRTAAAAEFKAISRLIR